MINRLLVCLALFVVGSALSPAAPSKFDELRKWLNKIWNVDPSVVEKLTAYKGWHVPVLGNRLVRLELATESEDVLWGPCGGCRSPILTKAGEIAVLRADAIFLVSPKTKEARQVPMEKRQGGAIGELLGPGPEAGTILVLFEDSSAPSRCRLWLRSFDLKSGRLSMLKEAPDCVDGPAGFIKPDWLRAGKVIDSTDVSPRQLLIADLSAATENSRLKYRFLTPKINEKDDGVGRFDPVWLDDQTVVYVANP